MNEIDRKHLYLALGAPFSEEAVERTKGSTTGRGYDTTGIKYQYVVNRLNEVLGFGCFRAHRTVTVKEFKRSNGRTAFEGICDLTLELGHWENGNFIVFAESLADGGHVASSEADARKGCFTNAFKKAAAFFGVGKQAYEGSIDDDNLPVEVEGGAPVGSSKSLDVATFSRSSSSRAPTIPEGAGAPVESLVHSPAVNSSDQAATTTSTSTGTPPTTRPNTASGRQMQAIWTLARKLGFNQANFRAKVKTDLGKGLEQVSREEASMLISRMQAALNTNGHAAPQEQVQQA